MILMALVNHFTDFGVLIRRGELKVHSLAPLTMASSGPRLWTPRLYPYTDDKRIFGMSPFCEATEVYLASSRMSQKRGGIEPTGHGAALWVILEKDLATERWLEFVTDWLSFALGGEVVAAMPQDAIRLAWIVILDVLSLRFAHKGSHDGDALALKVLLDAQHRNFEAYLFPPHDYSFVDDLETREADILVDEDEDEDEDNSMDGLNAGADEIPNFNHSATAPSSRPYIPKESVPLENAAEEMPAIWFQHISVFFWPVAQPKHFRRSPKDIINDYCQMRDLPARDYKSESFQETLNSSGLLARLHEICELGNLLETTHPDVENSFRYHNWKISYAQIICRWTSATITEDEYKRRCPKEDKDYQFSDADAEELFRFISRKKEMHPWGYNPFAAYFLLSQACFRFYSETWLAPCLRTLEYPKIEGWNPDIVYRIIMQTPLLQNADSASSQEFLKEVDRRLSVVIHETWAHRKLMHRVNTESFRPPITSSRIASTSKKLAQSIATSTSKKPAQSLRDDEKRLRAVAKSSKKARRFHAARKTKAAATAQERRGTSSVQMEVLGDKFLPEEEEVSCRACHDKKMDECCVRILEVDERPDTADLVGAALTCAPPHDCLQPLPQPQRRDGTTPPARDIRFVNPKDLGLMWVRPRPETFKRCGRDITRFIMRSDRNISDSSGVRRRDTMQAWAYGSMTGAGARQPMGGIKGDDSDVLVEIGTSIVPSLRSDVITMTNVDEVTRMGKHGLTCFSCTNYISALHEDRDIGLEDIGERHKSKDCEGGCYPCAQLEQTGTDKSRHEWDFAYIGVGIVIETWPNTVWCFNGRIRHGSIMPGNNSYYRNNAMSSGIHPTKRERDAARAAAICQIRHGMQLRPRI
ncbi:hypothetical protein B0H14DRAFT_3176117 [Mycena olivaceomarginata]|nr:hypothetical protein B0H14DRAFT_3176117 [Mycena olivaceomarginata]